MIRQGKLISWSALGGALVAVTLAAGGCRKGRGVVPTEKLLVTRVAIAPAVAEPLPDAHAIRTVTWGDVYRGRARQPDFKWKGAFRGRPRSAPASWR